MSAEYMPAGGVRELLKTAEGRRYLAKLQKKYEIERLQPSDPRFQKIYGAKLQEQKRIEEKKRRLAENEWGHLQELKRHEKSKSI